MGGVSLRLLQLVLLLLCISHPILLNAIPVTRTRNLEHASVNGYGVPKYIYSVSTARTSMERDMAGRISRRMDVELHDYSGPGPNPRHTPKPPPQVR